MPAILGIQTIQLIGITSGSPDENQSLTVTAVSSNANIAGVTVDYISSNSIGTLIINPVSQGSVIITLTVDDGGAANNTVSESFNLTVTTPPNSQPTLDRISDALIQPNLGWNTIPLTGITSGSQNESQTLTVTAVSSNASNVRVVRVDYASPDTTGNLIIEPVSSGASVITVTVNDGGVSNNNISRSFRVDVPNFPRIVGPVDNVEINENFESLTVDLTSITSGSSDENQTLTITAVSDDPEIIPNPEINYISPNTAAKLIFTSVPEADGQVRITVIVTDGASVNNTTNQIFFIHVNPVINLGDAITGLKVLAGIDIRKTRFGETGIDDPRLFFDADINGNKKVEIQEVIYTLQKVAGLR